jgi:hypothetical protein
MNAAITNAFQMAQQQFDQVADQLKLDEQVREYLRWPLREFSFRIPVRMQGRHPLPSIRNCGYCTRAGYVDDLEMRRGGYPAGRRQGRRDR